MGIGLVLTAVAVLFVGLWAAQRRYDLPPEGTRKTVHVLIGGITFTFPWLFEAFWPVAVLGGLTGGSMIAVRSVPQLRTTIGSVLHRVSRDSYGEIYFAVAVVVLFGLTGNDPLLYGIPILLLGLADPTAALMGGRYGQSFYQTSDGIKSGEGSASFFLVAFFCVHVPLLLGTNTGRLETLLIALIAGFLVMLLEAIAWRGLDNLFIPLGGYALLSTHLAMDAYNLIARLVVIAGLFVLATVWHRETTLDHSATFAAALVGVVTWMIGGWKWLLAPAALYFGYTILWPSSARLKSSDSKPPTLHTVHNVLGVAAVGFGWLFLSVVIDEPSLIYPYTLAYAGYLGLIGAERLRSYPYPFSEPRILGSSTFKSCTALLGPFLVVEGFGMYLLPLCAGLLGTVFLTAVLYLQWPSFFEEAPSDFLVYLRRALLVTATSNLGLPILLASAHPAPL